MYVCVCVCARARPRSFITHTHNVCVCVCAVLSHTHTHTHKHTHTHTHTTKVRHHHVRAVLRGLDASGILTLPQNGTKEDREVLVRRAAEANILKSFLIFFFWSSRKRGSRGFGTTRRNPRKNDFFFGAPANWHKGRSWGLDTTAQPRNTDPNFCFRKNVRRAFSGTQIWSALCTVVFQSACTRALVCEIFFFPKYMH